MEGSGILHALHRKQEHLSLPQTRLTSSPSLKVQTARVSLGLCPTCGIATHQKDDNGNLIPLSNSDVFKSRCLLCNPVANAGNTVMSLPIRRTNSLVSDSSINSWPKFKQPNAIFDSNLSNSNHGLSNSNHGRHSLQHQQRPQWNGQYGLSPTTTTNMLDALPPPTNLNNNDGSITSSKSTNSSKHNQAEQQDAFNERRYSSSLEDDFEGDLRSSLGSNPLQTVAKKGGGLLRNKHGSFKEVKPTPVASNLILQAAASKQNERQFQEGWNYLMGDHHTVISRKLGQSFIVKAMHDGSNVARGFCLFRGWADFKQDHVEAWKIFSEAADLGNANALAMKGYFKRSGYGTKQDHLEAIKFFSAAAERKHSWSISMLGFCYQEGEEIPRNNEKAFQLYRRAANMGYAKAKYNLAEMFARGIGVEKDKFEASKWYQSAADQDYNSALVKLDDLERAGSESESSVEVIKPQRRRGLFGLRKPLKSTTKDAKEDASVKSSHSLDSSHRHRDRKSHKKNSSRRRHERRKKVRSSTGIS